MHRRVGKYLTMASLARQTHLSTAIFAMICVVGTLALVPVALSASQETQQPDGAAAEHRQASIREALSKLGPHPWAGEYYRGDGLGENISMSLAPDAGVSVIWTGCLGLYGANQGSIVERDGVLALQYEAPNRKGSGGFPDTLRSVHWGERRYLIPDDKRIDFVNDINLGREPRTRPYGRVLLARGDEVKQAPGFPDLPEHFRNLIRATPLQVGVRVAQRGEYKQVGEGLCLSSYQLTLDHGLHDGLVEGVELRVVSPNKSVENVVIRKASDTQSEAQWEHWDIDCKADGPVPDRSWRLTTGAYAPKPRKVS